VREGSFSGTPKLILTSSLDGLNIMQDKELIEKIKALPPDKIAEVVEFVDFLAQRDDRLLVRAASRLSEPAFAEVWNNPDDSEYESL
jgi:hypothetical protein